MFERAPYIDVVFGTHNVGSLPLLLERARVEGQSQVEIKEALEHFPSTLPARRHSPITPAPSASSRLSVDWRKTGHRMRSWMRSERWLMMASLK
jgi:hypothetical protein